MIIYLCVFSSPLSSADCSTDLRLYQQSQVRGGNNLLWVSQFVSHATRRGVVEALLLGWIH